jgi:hypothetical protein
LAPVSGLRKDHFGSPTSAKVTSCNSTTLSAQACCLELSHLRKTKLHATHLLPITTQGSDWIGWDWSGQDRTGVNWIGLESLPVYLSGSLYVVYEAIPIHSAS